MDAADLVDVLLVWTPYLAGGFAWNIVISVVSMLLGTAVGAILAVARLSRRNALALPARALTGICRNVPTFVFLFYVAFLLPPELHLGSGVSLPLPAWLKAALALSVAVVGYISDTLSGTLLDHRAGRQEAMLLFLPASVAYFLIIVMASSTASVIGVNEIVSRANTVISATGRQDLMVWIYLYAMAWFLILCWPLTLLMSAAQRQIRTRANRSEDVGQGSAALP